MATHHAQPKPSQVKLETKSRSRHRSHHVMETSDALNIEPDTFKSRSLAWIVVSLRALAEYSRRHKGTAFQSAILMLTLYINRTGHNLSGGRRRILECAKAALRTEFGHPAQSTAKVRH